ncbi:hypothetical protein [Methylobacterium sp. E-046]|uniref:hypothetical protein n=1 Tax=Methylobacterium sp. E-046 TaxID=2836576 RepID=UPI001FB870CB|nr:hypothetical protein [Methylobacterium sp. E-046]MCJ2102396.1 hypothetical protein [Methylobacterium sp. E-046]
MLPDVRICSETLEDVLCTPVHPRVRIGYLDSRPAARHLERMDAGLTLAKLIGPIAAATILNAFWFAAVWRGHQYERRQGKMPWQFDLALGAYIAAAGVALYPADITITNSPGKFPERKARSGAPVQGREERREGGGGNGTAAPNGDDGGRDERPAIQVVNGEVPRAVGETENAVIAARMPIFTRSVAGTR